MKSDQNFDRERNIERKLRKIPALIPVLTYTMACLFLAGVYYCMVLYKNGMYWSCIPAGLLAHSFLIVCLHDASHKAITKTSFDRFYLNFCAGLLLLPFYGEHYRKYHLTHHANTNKELGPICPPVTRELYLKRRFLYVICEFIPLLYTLVGILNYHLRKKDTIPASRPRNIPVNKPLIGMAFLISIGVIWLVEPPIWYALGTLFALNFFSVLRNWCEHIGTATDKESNTYWFPLGMGVGNHETHHHHSNLSWVTLTLGLYHRKKDTNPIKALWGILFNKSYTYYKDF